MLLLFISMTWIHAHVCSSNSSPSPIAVVTVLNNQTRPATVSKNETVGVSGNKIIEFENKTNVTTSKESNGLKTVAINSSQIDEFDRTDIISGNQSNDSQAAVKSGNKLTKNETVAISDNQSNNNETAMTSNNQLNKNEAVDISGNQSNDNETVVVINNQLNKNETVAISGNQSNDNETVVVINNQLNKTEANSMNGNQSSSIDTKDSPKFKQATVDDLRDILQKVETSKNFFIVPPLSVIGIAGNSLVASVLFTKRKNNSSFIYMFSFLLCDILSLFSDLLVTFSYCLDLLDTEYWLKLGKEFRYWNESFVGFVLRCTAINIFCVLSIERLIAVKYPLRLKSALTVKHPGKFILVSFIIGLFSNILKLFTYRFAEVKNPKTNETIYKTVYTDFHLNHKENLDIVFILMKFFAGFVQVIFFTGISFVIVYTIRRNASRMQELRATKQTYSQVQVSLAKIFLILSLTNAFAFLPNTITPIISRLFPSLGIDITKSSTKLILQSFKFFRVLNSASDFIVMLALSVDIRKSVKNTLAKTKFQKSRRKSDSSSL